MGRSEVRASFHIREGPSEALCVSLPLDQHLSRPRIFRSPPRARSCLRMPSILNLKFKVRPVACPGCKCSTGSISCRPTRATSPSSPFPTSATPTRSPRPGRCVLRRRGRRRGQNPSSVHVVVVVESREREPPDTRRRRTKGRSRKGHATTRKTAPHRTLYARAERVALPEWLPS